MTFYGKKYLSEAPLADMRDAAFIREYGQQTFRAFIKNPFLLSLPTSSVWEDEFLKGLWRIKDCRIFIRRVAFCFLNGINRESLKSIELYLLRQEAQFPVHMR